MTKVELANQYFNEGYNCAQSVIATFSEEFGLKKEVALKLAKNFGAGCLHRGEMCGAISGALMLYGLKYGSENPNDELSEEIVYYLSKKHVKEFEKIHGTIICKDLLGIDIGSIEETNSEIDISKIKLKCHDFVKDSATIINNQLEESRK
ncbi:MAG: C_GCAxxG_C_C family protein [Bacteroidetes bacterium]|nr:C_GCAxxG_C_C family protein [Bacteroidota bacterium]